MHDFFTTKIDYFKLADLCSSRFKAKDPEWRAKVRENSLRQWKEKREEMLKAIRNSCTPDVIKKRAEGRMKYFNEHPEELKYLKNIDRKKKIWIKEP